MLKRKRIKRKKINLPESKIYYTAAVFKTVQMAED